jgi:hypothetical protein
MNTQKLPKGSSMVTTSSSRFSSFQRTKKITLGPILLVEKDPKLNQSRAMLLSTLKMSIEKAAGYCDVCDLSKRTSFSLIVISLVPDQDEAAKIATYVRGQWPSAKILLLGSLQGDFDDPLYDDIVDSSFNPSAFVDASKHLLNILGANLSV